MELYQLRTFVAVAEEKNVTRAAKRLYTTPPSVSAHIKALEEELNVVLFERTSKGMQITQKGQVLWSKATQVLHSAQDLVNHATQMQSYLMGHLNVGLNTTPQFLKVGPVVQQMQQTCPGIDLNFVGSSSGKIWLDLKRQTLDVGHLFGSVSDDALKTHYLGQAKLVVAGPKAWQNELTKATWTDLAAWPWVCSTGYCPFQDIVAARFAQIKITYQKVVSSDDEATKSELVKAGVGLALLERSECELAGQTGDIAIWDKEPVQCDLSLAYLRERADDPLIQALQKVVVSLWLSPTK